MSDYIHWRDNMDMPYLRAEHLRPKERRVLTIKEVRKELMPKIPGKSGNNTDEHQNVAYFEEEGVLPMVLNVTNCQTIESLYGTGNVLDWAGKKIQIFATKIKVGGELVPCLRVDKVKPVGTEITYSCAVCGSVMSKEAYDKSVARFGKPYCSKECYESDTIGKKIDL